MAREMRVSTIVPVRDAGESLARLVDAWQAQTILAQERELIVVDDGSRDGAPQRITAAGVVVVRVDTPRGSYAARNVGLRHARGAAISFTDSDCVPAASWLERGLLALERAPRAAGRVEMAATELIEKLDASRFLRQRRYVDEGWGATANLFWQRQVLERVGPFRDKLISGGDQEHGVRAQALSLPIVYADDAVVVHPARASVVAVVKKAFRVGFGAGQVLLEPKGERRARRMGARALDRLATVRLRELDERGIRVSTSERAALVAGHALLDASTLAGCAAGALASLLEART